jgi:hypothetical protein
MPLFFEDALEELSDLLVIIDYEDVQQGLSCRGAGERGFRSWEEREAVGVW